MIRYLVLLVVLLQAILTSALPSPPYLSHNGLSHRDLARLRTIDDRLWRRATTLQKRFEIWNELTLEQPLAEQSRLRKRGLLTKRTPHPSDSLNVPTHDHIPPTGRSPSVSSNKPLPAIPHKENKPASKSKAASKPAEHKAAGKASGSDSKGKGKAPEQKPTPGNPQPKGQSKSAKRRAKQKEKAAKAAAGPEMKEPEPKKPAKSWYEKSKESKEKDEKVNGEEKKKKKSKLSKMGDSIKNVFKGKDKKAYEHNLKYEYHAPTKLGGIASMMDKEYKNKHGVTHSQVNFETWRSKQYTPTAERNKAYATVMGQQKAEWDNDVKHVVTGAQVVGAGVGAVSAGSGLGNVLHVFGAVH